MILNGSMYMLRPFDKEGKPVRHQDPQLESTLKEIYEIVSDRSLPPLPDLEVRGRPFLGGPPPPP